MWGIFFEILFLRQKFRVSFEEFDVFVSVCAISNFEHVHHGGRGGEGRGATSLLAVEKRRVGYSLVGCK